MKVFGDGFEFDNSLRPERTTYGCDAVLNKMKVTDSHENEKIRNGAEKKAICREIIVMLNEEKQKEKANFVTLKNRKNARFRTSARTYAIFHT